MCCFVDAFRMFFYFDPGLPEFFGAIRAEVDSEGVTGHTGEFDFDRPEAHLPDISAYEFVTGDSTAVSMLLLLWAHSLFLA